MKSAAVSALALVCLFSGDAAYAQESNQCDGIVSILRISNYVDSGSEEGLREASEKHDAWYKSHGVTANRQVVIPILQYDEDTDSVVKDSSRVSTLHLNSAVSAAAREQQGDLMWNEFIALYNKNTEVADTIFVCLPESLFSSR
jgi:glutathionyl-hydroquinone reductase|tara:strand:- start:156 stop:587 length:432 start_codon:yes stop_codon:yes gene_type:complete